MSHDAAHRRATAARLALRFPVVLKMLEDGELHMSALLRLKDYLRETNHLELLGAVVDKTKEEIDAMIAERFPRPDVPSDIRPAPVLPGDRLPPPGLLSEAFSGGMTPPGCNERSILEPLSPGRHRVEFTASSELRAKLEHARSLMRHSNPKGDFGFIVERALDLLIPRLERERFGKTLKPRKPDVPTPDAHADDIPAAVRDVVSERDGYQCTFCSDDGHRCGSRDFLQFDHVLPKARGGKNTVENIRLRCHAHNQLEAAKVFGRDHIDKRTKERQQRKSGEPKPITPEKDEIKRATFKSAEFALVHQGFTKKEAIEALATVGPPMQPPAAHSVKAVYLEALAFLT